MGTSLRVSKGTRSMRNLLLRRHQTTWRAALAALVVVVASGRATATVSLETARYLQSATLLGDGTVLVVGGYNGAVLASAEIYDPATGTFSVTGSLATGR